MVVPAAWPPTLAGWTHTYSGKVRELYLPAGEAEHAHPDLALVIASDRISAFDFVLEPSIPEKGALLTQLSKWWFEQFPDVPNHLRNGLQPPAQYEASSMIVERLQMIPIECVVRGYLTGSGFAEYQETGEVCGIPLPAGLNNGDKLSKPIFTPAFKAEQGEHDRNIDFAETVSIIGEELAVKIRDLSLRVYARASEIAEKSGLIIADTKFEFGIDKNGVVTLADEVLTSDSSRYWDGDTWLSEPSGKKSLASFDKQIVRDWLSTNWDKQGTPPELPVEIVERTRFKYQELFEKLTGAYFLG